MQEADRHLVVRAHDGVEKSLLDEALPSNISPARLPQPDERFALRQASLVHGLAPPGHTLARHEPLLGARHAGNVPVSQRQKVLRELARTTTLIRANHRDPAPERVSTRHRDNRHGCTLGGHGLGEGIHRRDDDDRLGSQGREMIEGACHVLDAETVKGHD